MSGFGTVVGFMFSFFIMMFLLFGSFFIYQNQVNENLEVINSVESRYVESVLAQYNLQSPYYSSGRINFILDNGDNAKLTTSQNNQQCFDFFVGQDFISQEFYKMGPMGDISADYSFIEQSEIGYISILSDSSAYNTKLTLKSISCGGVENTYIIEEDKWDWWNEDWTQRVIVDTSNPSDYNLTEYQLQIDLNSSHLEIGEVLEDDLRVVLPIKEQYVLDLPFDKFQLEPTDYSQYSNEVALGSFKAADSNDPTKEKNGVISNGLNFNGSQFITINPSSTLEMVSEVTYSMWVKWDGEGDFIQSIYTSGGESGGLEIINDGGVNQNLTRFYLNVSGSITQLYSNKKIRENDWTHVVGTYDGLEMRLYVDGELDSSQNVTGEITPQSDPNYIGSNGNSNYFTGGIDEVKVLDISLEESEVVDLFENSLRFRELDFYVAKWDQINEVGTIFAKQPYLGSQNNVSLHIYYSPLTQITTQSDIYDTFSYKFARTVGYIVNDRTAGLAGLNIMSLYDNNSIQVQDDSFSLDEQQSTTLGSASISASDEVRMKFLAMVEGNDDATEIIVPQSWAGTDFVYSGLREGTDRLCMLSPWGVASYEIFENGVSLATGSVSNTGTCVDVSIATGSNARITADIPILAANAPTSQDAFIFYPATSRSLYGIPSQQLYVAASTSGASGTIYESDGTINGFSIGSLGTLNQGGNGADAGGPAFLIESDNPIGAIQQADGEGTESTTFVPEIEFGTKFGSAFAVEHLAVFSSNSDANCTSYDSTGTLIDNIATGSGTNGIYKYGFGTGSDTLYAGADWKLECDKPVWLYFEQDIYSDERMPFGHLQMRQYVYPEPIISIN